MTKTLNTFRGMTKRNIRVYGKNKTVVFFSLLTQIIILGLYLLFLRVNYVEGIKSGMGDLAGLLSSEDIDSLVNSWLVCGVIGTSVITVALNTLAVIVNDRQQKISNDYSASPVKGYTVVLSYFTSTVITSFVMSAVLLSAGFIFVCAGNDLTFKIEQILSMYGVTALGTISATTVLMFIVSFIKRSSTFSSFGLMISTGIGFIIGAYIPVAQFSESIQTIVNLVPGSQVAGMMRNILMQPAIDNIKSKLGAEGAEMFIESTKGMFGTSLNLFGNEVDFNFMMLYTIGTIALFLLANLVFYKISSKNKE